MKIQPVILCGGSGTRLWPLSRKSLPKQFVPLIKGKSLLQATFERVAPLAQGVAIWAVANEEHRFLVRDAAEAAGVTCTSILEPVGRNTAPAMAAAALYANPSDLLLFVPADHHIPDHEHFLAAIRAGEEAAQEGRIVTLGVAPTSPHTGYGYIQVSELITPAKKEEITAFDVLRFVEKPDQSTAIGYLSSGTYFWNAGVFLVRADALLQALQEHAEDILLAATQAVSKKRTDASFLFLDKEAFAGCRAQSIDYAVLEPHDKVSMVPYTGAWSDVGSWNAVAELQQADAMNNRISGNGLTLAAESTYINAPHRPVVALGTKDLVIIDTIDAVLVAQVEHAEKVKDVVQALQEKSVPQATEHRFAARPWGQYDNIDEGQGFKVKRITVKPGASISLQLHKHRAEHWIVVKGNARVTRGEEIFKLEQNESTYIPAGMKHRLENPGTEPLEIIEVQSGGYLEEDDIVRFTDTYGRA